MFLPGDTPCAHGNVYRPHGLATARRGAQIRAWLLLSIASRSSCVVLRRGGQVDGVGGGGGGEGESHRPRVTPANIGEPPCLRSWSKEKGWILPEWLGHGLWRSSRSLDPSPTSTPFQGKGSSTETMPKHLERLSSTPRYLYSRCYTCRRDSILDR